MQGAVVDVSFAHIMDDVVIGCVDELGSLFVYRVTENSTGLIQVGNVGVAEHFTSITKVCYFSLYCR